MDALLQAQHELHIRMSHTHENLKKMGSAKLTLGLVQSAMALLDKKWNQIEEQHAVLRSTYWNEIKKSEYYVKDFIVVAETTYLAQRGTLLDLEHSLQSKAEDVTTERPRSGSVKGALPRIRLPEFSGEFEEWPEFRDLFLSIINKDSTISGVEKLHYLKTTLKGSAANLLRNLPITDENFDRAWSMLTGHFENKRLLTQSYLSRFTSIPKMKGETVGDLSKIYHGMLSTEAALEGIKRPIAACSDFFVHLVVERMATRTRSEWEDAISSSTDPPSLEQLSKFLEHRMHTLEAISKASSTTKGESQGRSTRSHLAKRQNGKLNRCVCCSQNHYVMFCEQYKQKSAKERKDAIEKNGLCLNCLGKHSVSDCQSQKTCLKCSKRHHTTVHDAIATATSPVDVTGSSTTSHVTHRRNNAVVILATARVTVIDKFGEAHHARALIDPGSETSLASESLAQRLQVPRKHAAVTIFGVGGQKTATSKGRIQLTIHSRVGSASLAITALILPRLTSYGSKVSASRETWPHLRGLELADPDFLAQDSIDLLLGADVYATILQEGLKKGSSRAPIAQRTSLGWIISGIAGETASATGMSSNQCSITEDLNALVRKFWEQEEPTPTSLPLSAAEKQCEEFYVSTHSRKSDGRYVVRLPLAKALPNLSDTRWSAICSLRSMERRFATDASFRSMYTDFIQEYEALGHMTKVQPSPVEQQKRTCYLPHHGVLRAASQTTKLRVVFNGSQQTLAGDSLNQSLLVGPNLLPALADVITRWRGHKYVIISDVEKMYRQIEVHPDDRNLQRILWKTNSVIEEYQLNTVTYGLACAPYLAIRTLKQLANDEESHFPEGASALRRDVYVDDVLTGAHSIDEAVRLRNQLQNLCKAGGFLLRKWTSNSPSVVDDLPSNLCSQQSRSWQSGELHSALGLRWDPGSDCFAFVIQLRRIDTKLTKRSLLSETAQLFDPLGWLSPVIVSAKLLIQTTWLQRLDWDAPLQEQEAAQWTRLREELSLLNTVRVSRWIRSDVPGAKLELHGFADASERAYAAVAYLRAETEDGRVSTSLLLAKTRVAPLKRISLPRLELCAASLLLTLLWTDSIVTLGWIRGHPARWSTYVANRVSEIQRVLPNAAWHHIRSDQNPADCASRGLSPRSLISHPLWWHGPPLLSAGTVSWPKTPSYQEDELPEKRTRVHNAAVATALKESDLLVRFSTLSRLLRVTAWMLRWVRKDAATTNAYVLSPDELERAERVWIHHSQAIFFKAELSALRLHQQLDNRSAIKRLNPFIDDQGTLRVGGRLKHAPFSYDERHPIVLSPNSYFTGLIVQACHQRALHGGTQLTLSLVRQRFWIPRGRMVVKHKIHLCVTCVRWRAASPQPMMSNLPSVRVHPSRPFLRVGLDYAGPIFLRTTRGRGHKSYKAFICIFICMSSRAVHLEAVSDYTSDAFIAAFKRFCSRRGLCTDVYSDRGTNFVGANAQLQALFRAASTEAQQIANSVGNQGVRWHFNPPAAPHFGGIWEAAVKSVKHHLRRVIGDATLTFEEMSTLLSQIEACLNSRPLQAMSDDPTDLNVLTPGHFLIGEPVQCIPEPRLDEASDNQLTRWELIRKMRDHVWKRWSQEYLRELSARGKWWKPSKNLEVGQLCILRSEASPPSKWPLARIIAVHPGEDGQVRVVTVRTASSELTRPSVKIVPLPTACGNN